MELWFVVGGVQYEGGNVPRGKLVVTISVVVRRPAVTKSYRVERIDEPNPARYQLLVVFKYKFTWNASDRWTVMYPRDANS